MADYIRFDWAMKRMLRDKANYGILEGLITTLLGREVRIRTLLESEGNQQDYDDKFNRVDILAEDSRGELMIVEVQNSRELTYFHRMLYGVSKAIAEYMTLGQDYGKVRKVYSINIVYFSLGQGDDCVYHGKTVFCGIHEPHSDLRLSYAQCKRFFGDDFDERGDFPNAGVLFPEYYVLRVEDFNRVATTPLEEWLRYLKSGEVGERPKAAGLDEVQRRMIVDRMAPDEKSAYLKHVDNLSYEHGAVETGRYEGRLEGHAEGLIEGRAEGRAEGLAEGRAEGRAEGHAEGLAEGASSKAEEIARKLLQAGLPAEAVAAHTDLELPKVLEIGKSLCE